MSKSQSVEPQIANQINQQLTSYNLPYFLEQQTVNEEIENALTRALSKSGGTGGNRVQIIIARRCAQLLPNYD